MTLNLCSSVSHVSGHPKTKISVSWEMKNECKNVFIQFKKSQHPLSRRGVVKVNKAHSFISRDGHCGGKLDRSTAGQQNVAEAAVPGQKQSLLGLGSGRIMSNQNLKNQDPSTAPQALSTVCSR